VEKVQQYILSHWSLISFSLRFLNGIPQGMDIDWLKKQTPPNFGPEYLELREQLQAIEKQVQEKTQKMLEEQLSPQEAEMAAKLLAEFHTLSFSLETLEGGDKKSLITQAFKETGQVLDISIKPDAFIADLEQVSAVELASCEDKIGEFMRRHRQGMPMTAASMNKRRQANNAEKQLVEWLKAIVKFDARLKHLNPAQKLHILRVKQDFEKSIKDLGQGLNQWSISFAYGKQMPSEACENARQLDYHKEVLASGERIKIIIHMLTLLGAIEKKENVS
jgi:hypothetical protein